ncbi:EscR/YscR/HrcR family type III secretion system export apparatus protein [Candidatus Aerophobetes bacterium]|uniref:EscR/YscR/HrcR family type III secretion system export apparatus protein n=1 Tax=Aerophobetes bacterium TaxID=2030807 RepID=A0A2A4WY02_UNCAE|nr:MAG: EscR/YscR/HrcR family type III secretion system export apparatus protein [Candidatus Aerophobetes bacterium]
MTVFSRIFSKRAGRILSLLLCLGLFCSPLSLVSAQEESSNAVGSIQENQSSQKSGEPPGSEFFKTFDKSDGGAPNVLTMMSVIAMVALLPFAVILLTSFVKIVIVLSLLRNALGVQQAPPNQALNGIALLMTIYVMFPTGIAMYHGAKDYIDNNAPKTLFSADAAGYIITVVDKTKEPLKKFLIRNLISSHQRSFYQLAYKSIPKEYRSFLNKDDFIVVVPAYITSQIKGAFEVGVLIYLPFFVIDLVTSNILLAMGMMMLSPLTIALPLKLLLIVMTDGWTLIIQGLVQTYKL